MGEKTKNVWIPDGFLDAQYIFVFTMDFWIHDEFLHSRLIFVLTMCFTNIKKYVVIYKEIVCYFSACHCVVSQGSSSSVQKNRGAPQK